MNSNSQKLIFPELSYEINGILFTVHNTLGRYCNEKQYADALEKELKQKGVSYKREFYIDQLSSVENTEKRNKVDFVVDDKIILELKAKRMLVREDYYQLRRYLDAAEFKLGLLVNFRDRYLRPKRILNSKVS